MAITEGNVLELEGISKSFFGTQVLKDVNLSVRPGEIHALVGENGAGKTTLMNILFGMQVIFDTGGFEGRIILDGVPTDISSPREAMTYGIGMVHQEFMLIPGFTVAENIKLNREPTLPNLASKIFGRRLETVDEEAMRADSRAALDKLAISIDELALVAGLPVGHMQFVEIAREIDKRSVKLLVFDEPTAVLTESEAQMLLDAMKRLASEGIAILFITHRLDEVMEVADNITILRDGEVVAMMSKAEAEVEKIAELMVGRKVERIELPERAKEPSDRDIVLRIENLSVNMPGERVRNFSLNVRRGEILGIGGLAGHGKVGIANGVMGLYPSTGKVYANEKELRLNDPKSALEAGMAFVSEDRRGVGLLLDESIEMNIALTAMQVQEKFLRPGAIPSLRLADEAAIREHALQVIKDLDIRCNGPEQLVRRLSGGNQQKICLGRAFTMQPEVMWVSEPTRGIDVGAKQLVLDLLVDFNRKHGMTIIMTSSELGELRKVCDRIVIVYRGQIAGVLPPDASDVDFGLMMAGKGAARREVG
ncbi:MAG TPA: sugar ABC transporter ATP-binding protein [Bacillota bacterium]|nr:sugar ABC transporter ATP-binding protein [Bacillota bacterium]HOB42162.1 sugar ABC transporter ATP-binding protein [Bacillota bacterium]HPZ14153.1 sugar ABC transporter ATP-binding protein [Bacillota bacterium]HQD79635.1 sugar ABC transporter ATP-binding protein [Bacillota bacterium]